MRQEVNRHRWRWMLARNLSEIGSMMEDHKDNEQDPGDEAYDWSRRRTFSAMSPASECAAETGVHRFRKHDHRKGNHEHKRVTKRHSGVVIGNDARDHRRTCHQQSCTRHSVHDAMPRLTLKHHSAAACDTLSIHARSAARAYSVIPRMSPDIIALRDCFPSRLPHSSAHS